MQIGNRLALDAALVAHRDALDAGWQSYSVYTSTVVRLARAATKADRVLRGWPGINYEIKPGRRIAVVGTIPADSEETHAARLRAFIANADDARMASPEYPAAQDYLRARRTERIRARMHPANRPGDAAAVYAEETGVSYAAALVACNMD